MSQLIGGYIDIILKKKKDIGRREVEDDSTIAISEDIAPIQSKAVTTTTTSIGAGIFNQGQAGESLLPAGVLGSGMMGPQAMNLLGRGVQASKTGTFGTAKPITDVGII